MEEEWELVIHVWISKWDFTPKALQPRQGLYHWCWRTATKCQSPLPAQHSTWHCIHFSIIPCLGTHCSNFASESAKLKKTNRDPKEIVKKKICWQFPGCISWSTAETEPEFMILPYIKPLQAYSSRYTKSVLAGQGKLCSCKMLKNMAKEVTFALGFCSTNSFLWQWPFHRLLPKVNKWINPIF